MRHAAILTALMVLGLAGCEAPVVDWEERSCSPESKVEATITFTNNSTKSITTFWVDFECQETRYADVAPGTSYDQKTYVTHPGRIRDTVTGELLKEVPAPTAAGTTVVTYP